MTRSIRNDYLSKENTNCIKFICAIAIVFCHIFAYNPFGKNIGIGAIITAFGYLSVSVFLFFSGYGLMVQYLDKGDKSFEGYFKKRILPIYLIQTLLILFYSVFKLSIGYSISFKVLIQSFLFGNTVIQYGWYLQMIMLFYTIYYFCFCKSNCKNGCVKLFFLIAVYIAFCVILRLPSNWYEASWAFVCGVIWAREKKRIDSAMGDLYKYIYTVIFSFFIFVVAFLLGNSDVLPDSFRIPFKMISAVGFVVCVLFILMRVRIKFKLFEFGGKFYFEIYFMQGFAILLFNEVLNINYEFLRYIVCFASVFLFAMIAKPVVNWINNKCKSVRS